MRSIPLIVSALVLASIPAGLASSQNDAGSGTDAPNTPSQPVALSAGTYDGVLDLPSGDAADWYAVGSTAPAYYPTVHVHLEGASVRLHLGGATFDAPADVDTAVRLLGVEPTADAPNATLSYSLTLSFPAVPDVHVVSLGVSTQAGATGFTSTLHVVVENLGTVDAHTTFSAFATGNGYFTISPQQTIPGGAVTVPAGASVALDYPWDSTGDAGTITVHAAFDPIKQGDLNVADNAATAQADMPTPLPAGQGFVVPSAVGALLGALL